MKKVLIKFTVSNNKGTKYTEIEDYSDLIHEWITNCSNVTKKAVLSTIREGIFDIHEVKTSDVAYGFLESLWQSDRCPLFIMEDENLTIKVDVLVNEYLEEDVDMSRYEIISVSFNKDEDELIIKVWDGETDEYYSATMYSSDVMNARLLEKIE
ncbi:MAG: hypothetical protein ACOCRO_04435 [Halanaerobiales bacterium]